MTTICLAESFGYHFDIDDDGALFITHAGKTLGYVLPVSTGFDADDNYIGGLYAYCRFGGRPQDAGQDWHGRRTGALGAVCAATGVSDYDAAQWRWQRIVNNWQKETGQWS